MEEIILYAVMTLIVVAMLYSVLGKDVGKGPDAPVDPQDLIDRFTGGNNDAPNPEPQFDGPAAAGLAAIAGSENGFSQSGFLDGAKAAYGMILEAFAEGDKETLAGLLNNEVRELYTAAIDERIAKGLVQKTDLARLIDAEIVSADVSKKAATIRVLYEAELATSIHDKDGNLLEGDPDILSRVKEVWSYERMLGSKDPNWTLSGVEPHTTSGDEDGPDHSPDTV